MINFQNWAQMYQYLINGGELYDANTGTYVFAYNTLGALAICRLDEAEAKKIAKKAEIMKMSWSAFLEFGGQVLANSSYYEECCFLRDSEIEDEEIENAYLAPSYEFCKTTFDTLWCQTEDYLKILSKKPLYYHEISLIDGVYTVEPARESHLLRKNAGRIFDNRQDRLYMYTTSEEFPDILAITAAEIVREKIEKYKELISAQKELRHTILHQMTSEKLIADLEERD